ncbi:MAG: nitrite reductase [Betaproteobacteria bacterium CG2_30_68_42]|nr:MAG: nitrite reductase [Betaproteobacteria bacterium CG2_30_68_42]PJA56844.1 MAG: nitrite reductase [Rhodocyclales bacterium CG_4_9_14_3_um_filter_68_10]
MTILRNLSDASEIAHYEEALGRLADGTIDAERFTGLRLQMGVYGQRQEGVNMVRIKLPGGRLDVARLRAIADALEAHSRSEYAHITTRQDIQLHHVPLAGTPAVLRRLAAAGLTTREACGNTVRNITTCPLAGVCPREHVDVTTHLDGVVAHFLRNPLNQQMPRKFKISLSGCAADCAQGLFHDVAILAVREGGACGFRLLAGGGLGHKPHEAIQLAAFVAEEHLTGALEALITLHNRYSDRTKRAKSRLKFLVDRFGQEGFRARFEAEFARTRAALAGRPWPKGKWVAGNDGPVPGAGAPRTFFAQKQPDRYVLSVSVPLGHLSVAHLRGLSRVLADLGLDDIRTTQDQNLILLGVARTSLAAVAARIGELGLSVPRAGDNVAACPGSSTCRLGITSSLELAPKLSGGRHDLRVRVSGCHNGCAQPEAADIGIYGEGRRIAGRLVPHYRTYFGGSGMGGGALGFKGPSIPAMRIEQAVARVRQAFEEESVEGERFFAWARRAGAERFETLLADLERVAPHEAATLARDHGETGAFRVVPLGGGECGAANDVDIARHFFDAAHERAYREAFLFQRKPEEAAACAEAQLRIVGTAARDFLAGGEALQVGSAADSLRAQLASIDGDEPALRRVFAAIDRWIVEAAAACQARDAQLDLRDALPPHSRCGGWREVTTV